MTKSEKTSRSSLLVFSIHVRMPLSMSVSPSPFPAFVLVCALESTGKGEARHVPQGPPHRGDRQDVRCQEVAGLPAAAGAAGSSADCALPGHARSNPAPKGYADQETEGAAVVAIARERASPTRYRMGRPSSSMQSGAMSTARMSLGSRGAPAPPTSARLSESSA